MERLAEGGQERWRFPRGPTIHPLGSVCARVPPTLVAFVSRCMHARQIYRGELRGEWNERGRERWREREKERNREREREGGSKSWGTGNEKMEEGREQTDISSHSREFAIRLNKSNGEDPRKEMRNGRKGMKERKEWRWTELREDLDSLTRGS